jgi:hypothetical protein
LDVDQQFMHSFLRMVVGSSAPKASGLQIVEQQLPGAPTTTGDEVSDGSLPDAWIYGDGDWSLLVESKVQTKIEIGQLRRHLVTADRRGFPAAQLLLLSVETPRTLPERSSHCYWTDIYRWATRESRTSAWATRFVKYMEVTEARMLADGYLKEGTLTAFSGIHFDNQNPYSYAEAKRLLRLMTDELRKRQTLVKRLGMNPTGAGRGAITGQDAGRVWDFLRLKAATEDKVFTKFPHLTLSIENDRAVAQITIPDGLDGEYRRKLKAGGYDGFKQLVADFVCGADSVLKTDTSATPIIIVVQRHYPSQRSEPICDARMEFDPRTALGNKSDVKFQEQWLQAAYDAFANKQANIQVAVGLQFSFAKSQAIRDAAFVDLVEQSYLACEPFLKVMGLV